MTNPLSKYLAEISQRVTRNQEEIPKLIQPEKSLVRDTADFDRLIRIVEILSEAIQHGWGQTINPSNAMRLHWEASLKLRTAFEKAIAIASEGEK